MNMTLPASGPKPLYYNTFVKYIRSILDHMNIPYKVYGEVASNATKFDILIDDRIIAFDFSDHLALSDDSHCYSTYFKFHYSSDHHANYDNVHPFAPVSFYDWKQYYELAAKIRYNPMNSSTVLCKQRPYGNAIERRRKVIKMLMDAPNLCDVTCRTPQNIYWSFVGTCLTHVFVPGARNDMIDRGHMQYMAFGCCTIAPPIVDELPVIGKLIDGIHYVQCAPDYSDLIDKINWCLGNKTLCIKIGDSAKDAFLKSSTPEVLWGLIESNL